MNVLVLDPKTVFVEASEVYQMEQLDNFIQRKKEIDAFYREHLSGVGDISFQKVEKEVDANCWLMTIRSNQQERILQQLKANKIIARPFWTPMNQLPMSIDVVSA